MRRISVSHGLVYFLEELEHTEAALSADEDAKVFAPPFLQALDEWDVEFKKERLSRRDVIRANAIVAVRNEQLDATTMQFATAARALAAGLLERCFRTTPGQFVRMKLRDQAEKTQSVILVEVGKLDPGSPLQAFAPKLAKLASGSIQALDDRSKARGAQATIGNDVDEWKEGINSLRLTTYAELLKMADAKGYPKSWVESFFRREGREDAAPAAEPAPAADPTPAQPGGA
jgi:hypothetical protein